MDTPRGTVTLCLNSQVLLVFIHISMKIGLYIYRHLLYVLGKKKVIVREESLLRQRHRSRRFDPALV